MISVMHPAWSGSKNSKIVADPEAVDKDVEQIFLEEEEQIWGQLDIDKLNKSRPASIEITILSIHEFESMLVCLHFRRDLEELILKFAWIPLSVDNFLRLVKVLRTLTKLEKLDLHLKFGKSYEVEGLRILTETLLQLPNLKNWSLLESWKL